MSNRRLLILGAGSPRRRADRDVSPGIGRRMVGNADGPDDGMVGTSSQHRQTPPVPGAPTIEVEATGFAFQPERLTIDAGETLNLTLVNRGRLFHDLTIPELGIHLVAAPGETTATGLEVTAAGEYHSLCTVPGHAQAGMSARMVVEGA